MLFEKYLVKSLRNELSRLSFVDIVKEKNDVFEIIKEKNLEKSKNKFLVKNRNYLKKYVSKKHPFYFLYKKDLNVKFKDLCSYTPENYEQLKFIFSEKKLLNKINQENYNWGITISIQYVEKNPELIKFLINNKPEHIVLDLEKIVGNGLYTMSKSGNVAGFKFFYKNKYFEDFNSIEKIFKQTGLKTIENFSFIGTEECDNFKQSLILDFYNSEKNEVINAINKEENFMNIIRLYNLKNRISEKIEKFVNNKKNVSKI